MRTGLSEGVVHLETGEGAEGKVGGPCGGKDSQQHLGCEREELEVRAEGRRRRRPMESH